MKTPYLTIEKIRRAVEFLEKRKSHAKATDNKEWLKEFENVLSVIRELCGVDLNNG
jgi:hypothetical protein